MNWLFDDIEEEQVGSKVFDPRPYQLEADESIWSCLQDADMCGAYLATGTGKTEICLLYTSPSPRD